MKQLCDDCDGAGWFECTRACKDKQIVKRLEEELQGWIVEWKDFKPECGSAMVDQVGAKMVISVLQKILGEQLE